jgi:hypothetical protein
VRSFVTVALRIDRQTKCEQEAFTKMVLSVDWHAVYPPLFFAMVSALT